MITTAGNFDTGDLEISLNGENILDLSLNELNQTTEDFQYGLKEDLESAIKKAYRMGYLKAVYNLQATTPSV